MSDSLHNRKTLLLINLILLQALFTIAIGFYSYCNSQRILFHAFRGEFLVFVMALGFILALGSVYLVKEIQRLAQVEAEAKVQGTQLAERERFIQVLRSQHHDFANHLQVIGGSIQMGKSDRALEYINGVNEVLNLEVALKRLAREEFAVFVSLKLKEAESKGIKTNLHVSTDLERALISNTDLVRIVGNLLDNAIFALEKASQHTKLLEITIAREDEDIVIRIANNGPLIPLEIQEKIFDYGYTTKGSAGNGLGLHNVKELLFKNGGSVKVTSTEDKGTAFCVNLPVTKT